MVLSKTMGHSSKEVGHLSKESGRLISFLKHRNQLLEFCYEYPSTKVSIRELAAKTKISKSTVLYHIQSLRKEGIISKDNQWEDNWKNRFEKSHYFIQKMIQSGLIDYLEQELAASCIILFGSFSKGESILESDIDLFVECGRKKELSLTSFEKKLGHPIQLFMKTKITQLPEHLFHNVVNGIKLRGYFTLR